MWNGIWYLLIRTLACTLSDYLLMTYAMVVYAIFVETSKVDTWGNGVSVRPVIALKRPTKSDQA